MGPVPPVPPPHYGYPYRRKKRKSFLEEFLDFD